MCPDLKLPHVEVLDEMGVASEGDTTKKNSHKASLHRYRLASAKLFVLLNRIVGQNYVEKGSIDEAYLDLTPLVDRLLANGSP